MFAHSILESYMKSFLENASFHYSFKNCWGRGWRQRMGSSSPMLLYSRGSWGLQGIAAGVKAFVYSDEVPALLRWIKAGVNTLISAINSLSKMLCCSGVLFQCVCTSLLLQHKQASLDAFFILFFIWNTPVLINIRASQKCDHLVAQLPCLCGEIKILCGWRVYVDGNVVNIMCWNRPGTAQWGSSKVDMYFVMPSTW